MCKLGALSKTRLRKVHFSGDFVGVFDFLRSACSPGTPQETSKFNEITDFYTNAPCKSTLVFTIHLVCTLLNVEIDWQELSLEAVWASGSQSAESSKNWATVDPLTLSALRWDAAMATEFVAHMAAEFVAPKTGPKSQRKAKETTEGQICFRSPDSFRNFQKSRTQPGLTAQKVRSRERQR